MSVPEGKAAEILQAAETMFSEKGYHETTVADIVRRAGVAQGTLYLYFSGKQALFEALVDRFIGLIQAAIEDLDDGILSSQTSAEAVASVSALYERLLLVMWENGDLTRLLITEMRGLDEEFGRKLECFLASLLKEITRSLEAGVAAGMYRPVPDMRLAAYTLFSPLEYIFTSGIIQRKDQIQEVAHMLADLQVFGLAQTDRVEGGRRYA